MNCKKCGKCCRYFITWLEEKPTDDFIRWVSYHKKAHVVFYSKLQRYAVRIDIPCSKLRNGLCSIYESRPQDCRDYNCEDSRYPKPFTEVILKSENK